MIEQILALTVDALWLVLLLSAPAIATAAIVGLLVAFLQAVTQIQEQTLPFAFKFVAVALVLFLTGASVGSALHGFTERVFVEFPTARRH